MNDDLQDALEHTSELPLYFDFSPQRVDIHRKDYDRLLLIREELLRRINEENAERVELTESCVVDEAACIANNPLLCDVLRAIEMGERRDVSDKPKNDSESP